MGKKNKDNKAKKLWEDFKKFINRGNVVDMAIGVVIGGAFNAIVKTLTNILLSVATWGVPGGLNGLVTILPPLNPSQMPPEGFEVSYTLEEFLATSKAQGWTATQIGMYIQHGSSYFYKFSAIIDWGAFINAIISFLIIALTLFIILKVYHALQNRRRLLKEKAIEEYYKKHPELKPEEPKEEVPTSVEPTEKEVLMDIRDVLKSNAAMTDPRIAKRKQRHARLK